MSFNTNKKAYCAYAVLMCMILTLLSPVFAYAQANDATIVSDGEVYTLTAEPYENNLGLMASALDLANVFGFNANYDAENKSIEIESEKYGKVVLMHNATEFYSNGTNYPCAQYFYAENGVPMAEVGFFTNMFAASYAYNADANQITIYKNKLSDNVAKVISNDVTVPLYIEPHKSEYGLAVSLKDLAKAIGAEVSIDEATFDATLTNDTKGKFTLKNKGESFTSDFGTFECLPMYWEANGVPMITLDFFCMLYGISYDYDKSTKTVYINTELTQAEYDKTLYPEPEYSLLSDYKCDGTIEFEEVPEDGMNVKVIVQHISTRETYNGSTSYYIANTEIVKTEEVTQDDNQIYFEFNPRDIYTADYWMLSFEDENNGFYSYVDRNGDVAITADTTIENDYLLNYCWRYNNYGEYSLDLIAPATNKLYGKVSLPYKAPIDNLIQVELLMQVRGEPYKNIYNNDTYSIYGTYNVETLYFDSVTTEQYYNIMLDDYYYGSYPYVSLFYCVNNDYDNLFDPYGYYDKDGDTVPASYDYSYGVRSDAAYFDSLGSHKADLSIPYSSSYIPPIVSEITATGTNASQGQTISVPVKITENPGIAYLKYEIDYDSSYLTLESVENGTIFDDDEITEGVIKGDATGTRKYYTFLAYNGNGDKTNDGTVATFKFKVNDNIDLSERNYTDVMICGVEAYNIYEEPVTFNAEYAQITFKSVKLGDINADGLINGADLIRLAKYFAGWDVDLNETTFDANGDGKINRADLLRLAKHLLDPTGVKLGL